MTRLRMALAALLALAPALARADQPNPSFYLINRSNQAINEVYVSPPSSDGWGRDRLGDDKIEPNANTAIRLLADGTCVFDLRVVYADGHDEQRRAVNTCNVDDIVFGGPARPGIRDGSAPAAPATPATPPAGNPARDPSFRIVNRGNREIDEVYARVAGTADWGRDRLGDATISHDSYKVITLPRGQCVWDVRLVFADGQSSEKRRVNLCDVTDFPVP